MTQAARFKKLVVILAVFAALFVFLITTNPYKIALGWLIIPFGLLFSGLFLTCLLVLDWLKPNQSQPRKRLTIAAEVAMIPTLMLILSSVDQLSMSDGLIIAILGVCAIFYTSKVSFQK